MELGRSSLDPAVRVSLTARLGGKRPRVLAWAKTDDGAVVALPGSLAVLRGEAWSLVGWHEIHTLSWSDDGRNLRWVEVGTPEVEQTIEVAEPGELPAVARERVEQTFVLRHGVELAPGKLATIAARRPADQPGEISWMIVPARGVDLSRPELRRAADEALLTTRRMWN